MADASAGAPGRATLDRRLAVLLAMAMFVLVVDTSVMNVSIASVVHDLHTTVSGVQSAIALEALVSAAFILIGSKVGDLIGRKRAYVLGLLGYGIGALAMALAQGLTAIIIFWAVVGGLGASLLLPAMQSLIHGNFEGAAQRKAYALVGAAAAIAAGVGPLIGGFITTYLSWRIAFLLEDVVIVVVLAGIRLVRDVEYTGSRQVDVVGAVLSVVGMGGIVLGILVWQEGGEAVGLLLGLGAVSLGMLAWWLVRRKRAGKATLLDPDLFKAKLFRFGVSGQTLQQIGLGGAMIALPIYLQIVLEYSAMGAGLSIAPLSLSMFAVALVAGKKAGRRRPASLIRAGFALFTAGMVVVEPIVPRATSGWYLLVPLMIAGSGLGLLVSQLNNYTLAPIAEERVSEAAGVNSAGRIVRLVVRTGVRRCDPVGRAVPLVHQHGPVEHRAVHIGAAAGNHSVGARRAGGQQHATGTAAGRTTAADAGRDHPDQHPGTAYRAAGGASDSHPRRPDRAAHLLPHGALARSAAIGLRRSGGLGLTPRPAGLLEGSRERRSAAGPCSSG
jgi:MFS family permease